MQLVWRQYCFKKGDFQLSSLAEQEHLLDVEESKKLHCDFCKYHITDLDQAISVNNAHTHTFTNPGGFSYTIDCFRTAPGCTLVGSSSSEHTWFKDYAWQVAVCQSCREQLGWLFSNDGDQFYALISERLILI